MDHYEATMTICKKMLNKILRIEANHRSLMLATDNDGNRVRRRLGQAFRRMANFLYGVCSKIDIQFILNQISEKNRSKVFSKSNISEKIRFLQAEANYSTQQLELQQQKLEQNLKYLQEQQVLLFKTLINWRSEPNDNGSQTVPAMGVVSGGRAHSPYL
ncbi:Integrase H2C2 domain-containing protein [Aphis craccivora]|uniref:Integrase H2C2 domain-containing protein n=1 Tax=Aphis craccivora TaxID=307492 RepID=A0A6G0YF01_APHCR|nr:Integrase H2C2 domain-containing protein [Aphis craccivora]